MKNPFDTLYLLPVEKTQPHVVQVELIDHAGRYRIGPPTRPKISRDNGHLAKFKKREPELTDRLQLAKWIAILEASETFCKPKFSKHFSDCHGEDLSDANAAYRHFLFGKGADRVIDYDRYLKNDANGVALLSRIETDFKFHVTCIGKNRTRFSVTSTTYSIGNHQFGDYPATTNWQKALGAHLVWVSADVSISSVQGKITYDANMTLHMEDRYNFNPDAKDIATGIPDADNGRFEITGLGQQYDTFGTSMHHLQWKE
jgi:hypothetical protein